MKRPAWIFDTRSIVNVSKAEQAGFNVWQVGNHTNQKYLMKNIKFGKRTKKKLYLLLMDW